MESIENQLILTKSEIPSYLEKSRARHAIDTPIAVMIKAKDDHNGALAVERFAFTNLIKKAASVYNLYFCETESADLGSVFSSLALRDKISHLFVFCHGDKTSSEIGLCFGDNEEGVLYPKDVAKLPLTSHLIATAHIYFIACEAGVSIVPAFHEALPDAHVYGSKSCIRSPGYFFFPGERYPLLMAQEIIPGRPEILPVEAHGITPPSLIPIPITSTMKCHTDLATILQTTSIDDGIDLCLMNLARVGDAFTSQILTLPEKIDLLKATYETGGSPAPVAIALITNRKFAESKRYVIETLKRGDYKGYEEICALEEGLSRTELLTLAREGNHHAKIAYITYIISNQSRIFDPRELADFFIATLAEGYTYPIQITCELLSFVALSPHYAQLTHLAEFNETAQMALYYHLFTSNSDPKAAKSLFDSAAQEKNLIALYTIGFILMKHGSLNGAARMFGLSYELEESKSALQTLDLIEHNEEAFYQLFLKEAYIDPSALHRIL